MSFMKIKTKFALMFFMLVTNPVFADLPKPPDKDIANGTNDWADVGGALIIKALTMLCYALAAGILIGTAATVIKAFYVAQEKQDLGHFFKTLIVGVIAAAIGLGLIFAAYTVLQANQGN
jgi:hypothetical protein